MRQVLKRWGNSLALRIPASMANELSLKEGEEVQLEIHDGRLTVRPHRVTRRFSRDRLVQQFKGGELRRHTEIDFGDPVGTEWGGPDGPKWEGDQ
jgi:antitoxin MazE